MKTITFTTYSKTSHKPWRPQCVYYSYSTRDVLIGMSTWDEQNEIRTWYYFFGGRSHVIPKKGKVTRYNQTGQLTDTNNTARQQKIKTVRHHIFLTENNNGNVVLFDIMLFSNDHYEESGSIVVSESKGRHRFSYTSIRNIPTTLWNLH